jgi:hypothetical protein
MNTHLSELLRWILEPLATEMMDRFSEVNSGEDPKSRLDRLNAANKDWEPAAKLEGSLGEQPEVESVAKEAPGLCDCEECLSEGGGVTEAQRGEELRLKQGEVLRRGNRNKAALLRAKREELRDRSTNRYIRKHESLKWVSSRDVPNEIVQDRSKPMVVIGSDCVSLNPNLKKVESAEEAAEAVMEGNIKWKNINCVKSNKPVLFQKSRSDMSEGGGLRLARSCRKRSYSGPLQFCSQSSAREGVSGRLSGTWRTDCLLC